MKKVLLGCMVMFLVLVVGGGLASWYFVGRPLARAWSQVEALTRWDHRLTNQSPWTPPEAGLDSATAQEFAAIHREIIAAAGDPVQALGPALQRVHLYDRTEPPTLQELVASLGELPALLGTATTMRDAQIEALNRHGWSVGQYRWAGQAFWGAMIPAPELQALQERMVRGEITPDMLTGLGTGQTTPPEPGTLAAEIAPLRQESMTWLLLWAISQATTR
jgi:hypothetical protein